MKRFVGERIRRNEDPQLLTGQALFVDDVDLPGMLHAAFLRSSFAHARLRSIDTSAARRRPGVHAVFRPTIWVTSAGPVRSSCRRRRSTAASFTLAPKRRSRATRCGRSESL